MDVRGVRAVFRTDAETRALRAGRSHLPIEDLRRHHEERVRRARQAAARPEKSLQSPPELFHIYRLQLGARSSLRDTLAKLRRSPRVEFAEANQLYSPDGNLPDGNLPDGNLPDGDLPDDPHVDGDGDGAWSQEAWGQDFRDLWGLEATGWGEVWDRRESLWPDPARRGGGGVVVAVIDTGVAYDHPDLAANIWRDGDGHPGADFVDIDVQRYLDDGWVLDDDEDYTEADSDPQDRRGHGTHVAGTVAAVADNGVGVAGVAWGARLMPVRAGFVLKTRSGAVAGLLESDDVAAALIWATDQGADVINMSFGGVGGSSVIREALDYASAMGVVLIAAAGNSNSIARPFFPGSYPDVLGVAALDPDLERAWFSNWGDGVSLAAPGVDVLSAHAPGTVFTGEGRVVGEGYIRADGTSMAAPHVAGAAALILSRFPELTAREVRARLMGSAGSEDLFLPTPGPRFAISGGRLDLPASLERPAGPRFALRSFDLDASALGGSNGNGAAEPGEIVPLRLSLENVWEDAKRVVFQVAVDDPQVRVTSNPFRVTAWAGEHRVSKTAKLEIGSAVPRNHRLRVRIEIEGESTLGVPFRQERELELVLHDPATFAIAADTELFSEEAFGNLLPALDSDSAGNVVAVWRRARVSEGTGGALFGRLYDSQGQARSGLIPLIDPVEGSLGTPSVAFGGDTFAVVWLRRFASESFLEGRLFDSLGRPLGEVFPISDAQGPRVGPPRVAMDGRGRFIVVWDAYDEGSNRILARRFAADGRPLGDAFRVDTTRANSISGADVAAAVDGSFQVVWRVYRGTGDIHAFGRRFDGEGNPLGQDVQISQQPSPWALSPTLTAAQDGGFLVIWDHCNPTRSSGGDGVCSVRGRRLDDRGRPIGAESFLSPEEDELSIIEIDVASGPGGTFSVAWNACVPAGNVAITCDILERKVTAEGVGDGPTHRVDIYDELFTPRVARIRNGYFLAWDELGRWPDGVFGQILPDEAAPSACDAEDPSHLCLQEGRFQVSVRWRDFQGNVGGGRAADLTSDTGTFWFFDPDNVEIVVKVLDGRGINGHWWTFYGSLSNVEFSITVRDTVTGQERTYFNPLERFGSRADTRAFAEAAAASASTAPSVQEVEIEALLPLPRSQASAQCVPDSRTLCFGDRRFSARVDWATPQGTSGEGRAEALTADTGTFWFFQRTNVELVLKMLDGRALNGHWWIFFASLSNVEFTVTVTDGQTGEVRRYVNAQGDLASRGDTRAFP